MDVDTVDILLVEDNPHDAELTMRALSKNGWGDKLLQLENGADALDFIFCRGAFINRKGMPLPKVILLDLKLPKISGFEVLKSLRENKKTRLIPVVIVTSSQEKSDIDEAYKLGVNSYVVKPLDFCDFMNTISHIGLYWLMVNHPEN